MAMGSRKNDSTCRYRSLANNRVRNTKLSTLLHDCGWHAGSTQLLQSLASVFLRTTGYQTESPREAFPAPPPFHELHLLDEAEALGVQMSLV